MKVVFVSPFYREATLRFVRAALALGDVEVALIGQESQAEIERLDPRLRQRLAAHYQVRDCFDPAQLIDAVGRVRSYLGGVDRLLGILEQLQLPIAETRDRLGLPGLSLEVVRRFRDKSLMKDRLRAAGLPCARHTLAGSVAEAQAFAGRVGLPVIVKPPAGAGSVATYRVDTAEQLTRLLTRLGPGPAAPVMIEEFVRGAEQSLETVSVGGEHVWGSGTHYRPRPLEVVEQPWIQWTVLLPAAADASDFEAFTPVGRRALDALGMGTGLTHMEWFQRPDGTQAVSEVGARPPGAQIMSLMSMAHEVDMVSRWTELMIHERFTPAARVGAAGAAFLRAQGGGGLIRSVEGLDAARAELGDLIVEDWRLGEVVVSTIPPRPGWKPSPSYEGDGVVFVRHPETAVVRQALDRIIQVARVRT